MSVSKPELSDLAEELRRQAMVRRQSLDFVAQAEHARRIPCGYVSDVVRGPSELLIPDDPRALGCHYLTVTGETTSGGRPRKTYGAASATSGLNDRDFSIVHTLAAGIGHSASHQPAAVARQPDWVTYAMNAAHLSRLYDLAPFDLGNAANHWGDWADTYSTMEFLIKAFEGGVEWWWANADLLLTPDAIAATYPDRGPRAVLGLVESAVKGAPLLTATQAADRIHEMLPNKGFQTSQDSKVSMAGGVLSVILNKALGSRDKLSDKIEMMLHKAESHTATPEFVAAVEAVWSSPDIKLILPSSSWGAWTKARARVSESSPVCWSAARHFAEGLSILAEHAPLEAREGLDGMKTWIKSRARDVMLKRFDGGGSPEAAEALVMIAKGVVGLSQDLGGGVSASGGNLQREEAQRMRGSKWPHICIAHPDKRYPQIHVSFGDFMVYGLSTKATDRFALPLHRIGMLCDAEGRFLPYDQVVKVLEAEFNDFANGSDWGECPEDFIPAVKYALEQKGLNIDRVHGVEVDVDAWYPELGEDGIEDCGRLEVRLGVGPQVWTAVRYPHGTSSDVRGVVNSTAAAFIYNSYSDYAKQIWMSHRGLLGKGDEIRVANHDPKADLSPTMLQDFIAFCHEVVESDGPWHNFSSYDGCGDVYVYDADDEGDIGPAAGVVLFRSN